MRRAHLAGRGPELKLYLAFPDGVFHYICAECDALCCRGGGFSASWRHEAGPLLERYPALNTLAVSRRDDVVRFANAPSGCFFLRDDRRCEVEVSHGRALKPSVCRLFPFNAFTRLGPHVAVSPRFLCPLRLAVPPRPGEVEGTHAQLEPELLASPLLTSAYLTMQPAARLLVGLDADVLVERETAFRDACTAGLGQLPFARALAAGEQLAARAGAWLDMDPSTVERDALDDILLAVAPSLRLQLLNLPHDGIAAALLLFARWLRATRGPVQSPLTPQSVFHLFGELAPALRLLAYGERPLSAWKSGLEDVMPPFHERDLAVTAAGFYAATTAGAHLTDALEAALTSLPLPDRVPFATQMGRAVDRCT